VNGILIHDASMAKLTVDASAPSEDLAFVIDSSCVIVTQRELDYAMSTEFF
jgi:hypothetical protein